LGHKRKASAQSYIKLFLQTLGEGERKLSRGKVKKRFAWGGKEGNIEQGRKRTGDKPSHSSKRNRGGRKWM